MLECLRARRRAPRKLYVLSGAKGLEPVLEAAAGLETETRNRADLDRLVDGALHQGVVLEAEPLPLISVGQWLEGLPHGPSTVCVLDGIEDPQNFGAIVRSAAVFGLGGVLFRKDRAAPLSAAAIKSGAGGFEYIPLLQETNLSRGLMMLKEAGFWVLGLAGEAEQSIWEAPGVDRRALVVGSEGKGIRRLVREHCDLLVSIPATGAINTLNASVSAAIAMAAVTKP